MGTVRLVDARDAVLVDARALLEALDVLGDELQRVGGADDVLLGPGDGFWEDGDGVVGRLRESALGEVAFGAVRRREDGEGSLAVQTAGFLSRSRGADGAGGGDGGITLSSFGAK